MDNMDLGEQIKNEKNIETLRNMFLQEITRHESELVQIHETHENQIDLLQQQLSDQNIAVTSLQTQIKKLKEMHESELDSFRANERQSQDLLKKTLLENNELKSKIQQIETSKLLADSDQLDQTQSILSNLGSQNSSLQAQLLDNQEKLQKYKNLIQILHQNIQMISNDLDTTKKGISKFIKSTTKSLKFLYCISHQACDNTTELSHRIQKMYSGLANLKSQIQSIHSLEEAFNPSQFMKMNIRAYKVKIIRTIRDSIKKSNKIRNQKMTQIQEKKISNLEMICEQSHQLLTTIRLQAISFSSSIRLFSQSFKESLAQSREIIGKYSLRITSQQRSMKEKYTKQIKSRDQQISTMKNEIALLKKSNEISREKLTKLKGKLSNNPPTNIKKNTKSRPSSVLSKVEAKPVLVSIGVLAHIITTSAAQMQERTLRHSKEAELGVVQGQLTRMQEKNERLESQIGGLRKMLKKTEEISSEENLKAKQTSKDLETQLLEQKRLVQRKSAQILKLQESNEDLSRKAMRLDELKVAVKGIFSLISEKVEPILAEKSVSSELSELDELSQEFFNVPIHKICTTRAYGGFLKKQSRKLEGAMLNSIEQEQILKVFEDLLNEIEKLPPTSQ